MSRQHPDSRTLNTLTGSILVAAGLFLLFGHLVGAASQCNRLLQTMGEGFGVLSSVILASSFQHQQILHDLLRLFWPVLPVFAGSVLLHGASQPPCATRTSVGVRGQA